MARCGGVRVALFCGACGCAPFPLDEDPAASLAYELMWFADGLGDGGTPDVNRIGLLLSDVASTHQEGRSRSRVARAPASVRGRGPGESPMEGEYCDSATVEAESFQLEYDVRLLVEPRTVVDVEPRAVTVLDGTMDFGFDWHEDAAGTDWTVRASLSELVVGRCTSGRPDVRGPIEVDYALERPSGATARGALLLEYGGCEGGVQESGL